MVIVVTYKLTVSLFTGCILPSVCGFKYGGLIIPLKRKTIQVLILLQNPSRVDVVITKLK